MTEETLAQTKVRHTNILRRGWSRNSYLIDVDTVYKLVRAAVRAAIPGKQQAHNLNEVMEKAIKSAARALHNG